MAINPNCPQCQGIGWTCEVHVDKPMDHDDCRAAGQSCELCCPAGELPELPAGFVPSFAVDTLIDSVRSFPYSATGRVTSAASDSNASVPMCPTCGQLMDLSDISDVLHHAAKEHDRRRLGA